MAEAEVQTSSAHLQGPRAHGLGEPDLVLRLGGTCFPVHRALLAASSGVLDGLLKEFGGNELRLTGAEGGPAPVPKLEEAQLQLFLAAVYGCSSIKNEEQSLSLIQAADFYDSPGLLSQANTYLALDVISKTSPPTLGRGSCRFVSRLASGKLAEYLAIASKHRLRR